MNKLLLNDFCWCGSGKKYKKCHLEQDIFIRNIEDKVGYKVPRKAVKTEEQIDGIRKSCKLTHAVLDMVGQNKSGSNHR